MIKIKYESFDKAREFSRKLNLSSASKWRDFSCSSKRPINIPSHPDRHYKNNGWVSWMDWLGNNNKQYGNIKYAVNNDYFKKFSPNMAYVLGFWFADGCMNEKKNMFSITQHKKDRYLLESMLSDMNSNFPLSKHGNNFCFRITSPEIIKDIKNFGGIQRKSYTIKFPTNIPKEYLPDFIRGFWDGDGTVYFHNQGNAFLSSALSASYNFINDLLKVLRKEIIGFKGSITVYNNNYTLHVGVNDTRRLRDYLYKNIDNNSLYLIRKYEKFIKSGNINIASYNRVFLSYKDAQSFIKNLGIKKHKDWKNYKKNNNIENIPANPENTYKNKGWINWKTFVDTEFWSFKVAKKHIQSLNIKDVVEWKKYASGKNRPRNIPSNPWTAYKEWSGFKDWLGN